jgi:hypothetical protein
MAPSRKTMPSIPLFTFILYALALVTEVIDITKNPGYSIIVHKKPLPFPV